MSWPLVELGEIAKIVTGKTPSKKVDSFWSGDIPFVSPSELGKTQPVTESKVYVTEEGATKATILPENSILVCCIGSLGKIGIAGKKLVTNQQINAIICNEESLHHKYAYYACQLLKPIMEHIAPATTVKIINKSSFSELTIPLPPLEEQRRIAGILDKADALRRKKQKALDLCDQFLKALFIDLFGDPVTNPKGWEKVKLVDIADIKSGVTKGRKLKGEIVSVPYMRVANVQDGHICLEEIKEIEVMPSDVERYLLKANDILLTEGGDPDKLGRGAVWHNEITPCIHQNHIFRVRPNFSIIEPIYLSMLIGSDRGKRYFMKSAKQTTGIASINMTQLKGFVALQPPLDLQNKFAEIVKKTEAKKAKLQKSLDKLNDTFHALSQRAFAGKL